MGCDVIGYCPHPRNASVVLVHDKPNVRIVWKVGRGQPYQSIVLVGAMPSQADDPSIRRSNAERRLVAAGLYRSRRLRCEFREPLRLRRVLHVAKLTYRAMTPAALREVRSTAEGEVFGARVGCESEASNAATHNLLLFRRPESHKNVRLASRETAGFRIRRQLDTDRWKFLMQGWKARRDKVTGYAFSARDPYDASGFLIASANTSFKFDRIGFELFGFLAHLFAREGEDIAFGRAIQEANSKACLQRVQAPPDGGAGDFQFETRSGEAAVACDGEEEAEVVPIEHGHPRRVSEDTHLSFDPFKVDVGRLKIILEIP